MDRTPSQSQDTSGDEADEENASTSGSSFSLRGEGPFDPNEFKVAVFQLLDLLMDDKFSHPYGTVAGSVA